MKRWLTARAMAAIPFGLALLRRVRPIARFGSTWIVTRADDVHEVFATDHAFAVPYRPKLDVITGGQPFFLGLTDTPAYHAGTAAMRRVVRDDDLPALAARVEAAAGAIVDGAGGSLDVVADLVRPVAFGVLGAYFGVPDPPDGDLQTWGTRLFEFQFADGGDDPALRAEVDTIAPALRAHVQRTIEDRRAHPSPTNDVLARCLAFQAAGEPGFDDDAIRTALTCFIVGGPPQPPMVVPQAMEQLLRRPQALAGAQAAARANDDALLRGHVLEAMRFDPLAPGLPRTVVEDWALAGGTPHARTIPKGATVIAAFASAMMDPRRVADPARFDPRRPAGDYLHFGFRLHECFGRHINEATLHLMLKPLLARDTLRRAPRAAGRLSKAGIFAERLVVRYD